jgi:hypothetical protein
MAMTTGYPSGMDLTVTGSNGTITLDDEHLTVRSVHDTFQVERSQVTNAMIENATDLADGWLTLVFVNRPAIRLPAEQAITDRFTVMYSASSQAEFDSFMDVLMSLVDENQSG